MTVHSNIDYKCDSCGSLFIPLPGFNECPKCGYKSPEVFAQFTTKTLISARYNLVSYRSFVPPIWGTFNIGDHYYWTAFHFLYHAAKSLRFTKKDLISTVLSEDQINSLVTEFVGELEHGEQDYLETALRNYLSLLAESLGGEEALEVNKLAFDFSKSRRTGA
jgi:hypothetical protein